MMISETKFLTRKEAAEYLNNKGLPIAPATLAKKACSGDGPAHHLFGRQALYLAQELDVWASRRLGVALGCSGAN